MAEILLSLTIIGVVAAITLPSLTGNINERTWNTQRKALYARMSQAISLMPALNGYGILEEGDPNNVAEVFLTNGLAKVLKINNICNFENLKDCGVPPKITTMGNSVIDNFINDTPANNTLVNFNSAFNVSSVPIHGIYYNHSQIDTKAAAFETANGESILVHYNPSCNATGREINNHHMSQPSMCANFIYDLNGKKGPNAVGKDIGFITALYPIDPTVVAPMPALRNGNAAVVSTDTVKFKDASKTCTQHDTESRIPNKEELASLFYNNPLVHSSSDYFSWSGTSCPNTGWTANSAWSLSFKVGYFYVANKNLGYPIRCIKR